MTTDTRERILDAAQHLAQRRGFNAFSYADVSEAVGVRKASIHHHFASKDDLELALVQRYSEAFSEQLGELELRHAGAAKRLRGYAALYRSTLAQGAICLCGMMASDIQALPERLRAPLGSFFTGQARWLARVLEDGRRDSEFAFAGSPARRAQAVLAMLQGGLVVANATRDMALFDMLVEDMMGALRPPKAT